MRPPFVMPRPAHPSDVWTATAHIAMPLDQAEAISRAELAARDAERTPVAAAAEAGR